MYKLNTKMIPSGEDIIEMSGMLIKSGAAINTLEDWSGIENIQKIRPNHKWSKQRPHDFLTLPEKLTLIISTPAPLLLKEKGPGDEVFRVNSCE